MSLDLDDGPSLLSADPSGMLAAFAAGAEQLERSYRGALGVTIAAGPAARSLTVCAMGGSAAAGEIVTAAFQDRLPVPASILRGYRVPVALGPDDLVLCVSYSGNTEETVAAHATALGRGCQTVAVCGGGALAERAAAAGAPVVRIPTDSPVPRAGLGSLVGGCLGALVGAELLPAAEDDVADAARTLMELAASLAPEVLVEDNEAKAVAGWVGDRIPVVWGSEGVSGVAAWRWKTAFNENAEVPAFSAVLPELDHHEIVGWASGRGKGFCLIILREPGEDPSVPGRLAATLDELDGSGLEWREVRARGGGPLARAMSLSLIGDLASAYHALARGIDPAAMDALVRVKRRLAEER